MMASQLLADVDEQRSVARGHLREVGGRRDEQLRHMRIDGLWPCRRSRKTWRTSSRALAANSLSAQRAEGEPGRPDGMMLARARLEIIVPGIGELRLQALALEKRVARHAVGQASCIRAGPAGIRRSCRAIRRPVRARPFRRKLRQRGFAFGELLLDNRGRPACPWFGRAAGLPCGSVQLLKTPCSE